MAENNKNERLVFNLSTEGKSSAVKIQRLIEDMKREKKKRKHRKLQEHLKIRDSSFFYTDRQFREWMPVFRKCKDIGSLLLLFPLIIIACILQALGEVNGE
ncbi:hypothetical protein COJ48_06195 [Bacillus cereus]|nr:hypothetical protein COJ48_06195 [Bacillus cereus]PGP76752.1 hypothetical protein CN997_24125 [Bacillus cereus]